MSNQTMEKLSELRLYGVAAELKTQLENPTYHDLSFEDRLAALIDAEYLKRQNSRMIRRVREAKLKQSATIEDIDFHSPRKLEKSKLLELAGCNWIRNKHDLFITGPTGIGKTYIACALADKACRGGFKAFYRKTGDLISELLVARGDGSYPKYASKLARTHLLIIDEWLRDPLAQNQAREILDLLDDRFRTKSTIFVSQVPVSDWHKHIADPTIADAILDRIVHDSLRLELAGESMRKRTAKIKQRNEPEITT